VEAKRSADLIAVAGEPLRDIGELQRARFAMKGGLVVRNDFGDEMSHSQSHIFNHLERFYDHHRKIRFPFQGLSRLFW